MMPSKTKIQTDVTYLAKWIIFVSWLVLQTPSAKFNNFGPTMEPTQGIIYLAVTVFTIQICLCLCDFRLSFHWEIAVCKCMLIEINAHVYSSEWMCVFHRVRKRKETRALEEITPHSLRVLVTHALLAAEWFPHLHTEVREAAPTAPPVPLRVPAEPSWARIFLKKRTGRKH